MIVVQTDRYIAYSQQGMAKPLRLSPQMGGQSKWFDRTFIRGSEEVVGFT